MNAEMQRNPAKRVLACEFKQSNVVRKEGDGEMAPNMQVLRTGELANRVLLTGTLTDIEMGDDGSFITATILDPSGNVSPDDETHESIESTKNKKTEEFTVSAHQDYQSDSFNMLKELGERETVTTYVSVVGKSSIYSPDDDEDPETYVSLRPETIKEIDKPLRDMILNDIVSSTIDRMNAFENDPDEVVGEAQDEYGDDLERIRNGCISVLNDVSSES
jgi:RPA family protein